MILNKKMIASLKIFYKSFTKLDVNYILCLNIQKSWVSLGKWLPFKRLFRFFFEELESSLQKTNI